MQKSSQIIPDFQTNYRFPTEEIDKYIKEINPLNKKKFNYHIAKASDWRDLKEIINPEDNKEMHVYQETDLIRQLRKVGAIFVNDHFIPLWNITRGLMFLYGGYGSSKTTYAITRQLIKSIENKYHRCYYGRDKKTEARELHSNIITEIIRNGWEDKFDYSDKPNGITTITCKENGNKFIMFGCNDVDSLKGIDNPTDILIDEVNQLDFKAFGMLWTKLRTPGVEIQLMALFNNCDVMPDHWLVKYIFNEEESDEIENKILLDALKKAGIVKHISIYTDNLFQNFDKYLQQLIIQAGADEEKIKDYTEARWGVKLNQQVYYKKFKEDKIVKECFYDRDEAVYLSWDENVNPYLPVIFCQVKGTTLYIFDEIAAKNPNNDLKTVTNQIIRDYNFHKAGFVICGDATSRKDDVKTEDGSNFFTLIAGYLKDFFPRILVSSRNPSNAMRGNFMNMIFEYNYDGINIVISPKCKNLIADLKNCQESSDPKLVGHKDKTKVLVEGKRCQRWGHFGDALDYIVCEVFSTSYAKFQSGSNSFDITGGARVVKNGMDSLKQTFVPKSLDEDEKEDFSYRLLLKRKSNNRIT